MILAGGRRAPSNNKGGRATLMQDVSAEGSSQGYGEDAGHSEQRGH